MAVIFRPIPANTDGFTAPPPSVGADLHLSRVLGSLPGGGQAFWGVPFELRSSRSTKRWAWLGPEVARSVKWMVRSTANYLVFAHFCLPTNPKAVDRDLLTGRVDAAGELLATYTLLFADGDQHVQPVRRRFEVNDVLITWGHLAFAALPHRQIRPLDWRGPHEIGRWGHDQMASELPFYEGWTLELPRLRSVGNYWIYALHNPRGDVEIEEVRADSVGSGTVGIGGLTAFSGLGHPTRVGPLRTYRIATGGTRAPNIHLDRGVIARQYHSIPNEPEAWLGDSERGWGASHRDRRSALFADIAAADGATLTVDGTPCALVPEGANEHEHRVGRVTVQALSPLTRRLKVTVIDGSTGRPTPARVHFEAVDGRYLPPLGHRHEVNDGWFQDYGADLKLGDVQYAYVPGDFLIDLPQGDVLAEVVKGFEYYPLRTKISDYPEREGIGLTVEKMLDYRGNGWVAADVHVHFLSPETAWLEAKAEGVQIVNVLAAQWGDLFTSVGDFTGAMSGVSRDDTVVWVGSENRHHMLGHMSLLGIRGEVMPLSSGGPSEAYIGEPTHGSLAGLADAAKSLGGLVIVPHFPNPPCEVAADIVLGKIDGVEVRDFWSGVDTHAVRQWYRFLNLGYRVPIVGGTDKMSAGMPLGGVRTYAYVGDTDLSFATFAEAVRSGRTFTSSGPLIDFYVEGARPGGVLRLPNGESVVEVEATASCSHPLESLEIVLNGRVVLREEARPGTRTLRVQDKLSISDGGWVAARCTGRATAWHQWPVRMAAHTSPVYLGLSRGHESSDDRRYVEGLLQGGLVWLDTLAVASPNQLDAIRDVFHSAWRRFQSTRTT